MIEAHRPPGRQAKRLVAVVLMTALGVAVIAMREGIAASKPNPERFAELLVALGGALIVLAVLLGIATVRRMLSGAPVVAADADGIRLQTPLQTVRLGWADVDRIASAALQGQALLVVEPRRTSLARVLFGVRVQPLLAGKPLWGHAVSADELDVPPDELARKLEALRPRLP